MTNEEAKIWRDGYNAGIEEFQRKYKDELAIGVSITGVLDERYELASKDYD